MSREGLDLSLLALKVEERATNQGMKAASITFEKGKKMGSPLEPLERQ